MGSKRCFAVAPRSRFKQAKTLLPSLSDQTQGAAFMLAVGHEADPEEAENHHGPSGGFSKELKDRLHW